MAMTAAETGHLVLGTLHTTGAVKTIDRIIDALPAEEREQTKSFLSQSLIGGGDAGAGASTPTAAAARAVCEVMVMTRAIAKLIHDRPDAPDPEPAADRQGRSACRCSTRRCSRRSQAREIDPDDAFAYATDKRPVPRHVRHRHER